MLSVVGGTGSVLVMSGGDVTTVVTVGGDARETSTARPAGAVVISPAMMRRQNEAEPPTSAPVEQVAAMMATTTTTARAASRAGTSASTSSTSTTSSAASGLAARFRAYLAGRPQHVSVALYDAVSGSTVAVTDPAAAGYETASSVKLNILTALVARAGASGQLTARERQLARKMISVSDNAAASALWSDLGGTAAMNAFFARLGMSASTAGTGGRWGLTRTTAADQLKVLRAIAYPGTIVSAAGRTVIDKLLDAVVPAQRWGLTAGVPAGVSVDVKNGWLPRTSGWVISSLAHVSGAGRDYVMAVYTKNGPSMQSGISTVSGLSALAWQAAAVSAAIQ